MAGARSPAFSGSIPVGSCKTRSCPPKSYFCGEAGSLAWLGGGVCAAGTSLAGTGAGGRFGGTAGDCPNAPITYPKTAKPAERILVFIVSLPSAELQNLCPTRRGHINPEGVHASLTLVCRSVYGYCER